MDKEKSVLNSIVIRKARKEDCPEIIRLIKGLNEYEGNPSLPLPSVQCKLYFLIFSFDFFCKTKEMLFNIYFSKLKYVFAVFHQF